MSAKVYSLKTYRVKKAFFGMEKSELLNLAFNISFSFLSLFVLTTIFLYLGFTAPQNRFLGIIVGGMVMLFTLKHFLKLVEIYKEKQVQKEIEYLLEYQLYVTTLFSIISIGITIYFIFHFTMFIFFIIPFLLIVLWNIKQSSQMSQKYYDF